MPSARWVKLGRLSNPGASPLSKAALSLLPFHVRFHNSMDLTILKMARALDSTDNISVLPKRLGIGAVFVAITLMIFLSGCADVRHELTARAQQLLGWFSVAISSDGCCRGLDVCGKVRIVVHVAE